MKHRYYPKLLIIGWILGCLALPACGAEITAPAWQTGDAWTVKAVYRQFQSEEEWSAPVYWQYRVGARTTFNEEPCLEVLVTPKNDAPELSARLLYRITDFSLVSADLQKTRRGKTVSQVLSYDGGAPVRTEQTLIPFDMPVFPLNAPSETPFSVKKAVGQDMTMTEIIRQTTRRVTVVDEYADAPQGNYTRVECLASDNSSMFLQYWREDLPWPAYGRNTDMQYWFMGAE